MNSERYMNDCHKEHVGNPPHNCNSKWEHVRHSMDSGKASNSKIIALPL